MAGEAETSLLDDVRAAASELAGGNDGTEGTRDAGGTESARSPAQGDADQAREQPSRDRDEAGRFKAKAEGDKERPTLTLKEKPAETGIPATAAPTTEQPNGSQVAATGTEKPAEIPAPLEWKGLAKTQWPRLPRSVQAEIVERIQADNQRVAAYAPLEQAIAPYKEAWTRDAGSVEQAIGQLGQFYRLYLENPVGLIQHIAASRGINLGAPQGQQQPQGGGAPQAPDIASIVKQIVEQQVAPIQQRFAQTENQQLESTISAFASDPKHPFFQDVKTHMGQLLAGGSAKTLDEAYDQATWANPTIRAHLLAQQDEQRTKQQAAEVAKANAARAASLRGSPLPGGGNAAANGSASVLDDVRAAAAEIAGA